MTDKYKLMVETIQYKFNKLGIKVNMESMMKIIDQCTPYTISNLEDLFIIHPNQIERIRGKGEYQLAAVINEIIKDMVLEDPKRAIEREIPWHIRRGYYRYIRFNDYNDLAEYAMAMARDLNLIMDKEIMMTEMYEATKARRLHIANWVKCINKHFGDLTIGQFLTIPDTEYMKINGIHSKAIEAIETTKTHVRALVGRNYFQSHHN